MHAQMALRSKKKVRLKFSYLQTIAFDKGRFSYYSCLYQRGKTSLMIKLFLAHFSFSHLSSYLSCDKNSLDGTNNLITSHVTNNHFSIIALIVEIRTRWGNITINNKSRCHMGIRRLTVLTLHSCMPK